MPTLWTSPRTTHAPTRSGGACGWYSSSLGSWAASECSGWPEWSCATRGAYREVKEGRPDPREGEFGPQPPAARLSEAIYEFIRAVRAQLRVEHAGEIATDEPEDWPIPSQVKSKQ
ncbi:hypothetical protein Rhe02_34700 [Rhizocola hellebori]|uniref:Uncharacterized protein n=1 Tax=Rhizocola hellebori TaxID=1392758 RepID=A0A8J3Q7A7_9ACTN|nr:hypothetical protein Rhe02_34700 [Rhizocola hellebori]